MATLPELLRTVLELQGSDLHLTTQTPPQVRVHGKLQTLDLPMLGPVRDEGAGLQRADRRAEEALRGDARAGLLVRHPRPGAVPLQRVQPARRGGRGLPADSRADQDVRRAAAAGGDRPTLAERPRGLVLVTGPTGSGKSTTLAAMIDKINTERREHILTIEDPIEYIHAHKGCIVNQREVHSDTQGFAAALRSALREDPDIVLIGELRDLETIESALRIAETGHLTLGHAAHQFDRADDQPHHRRVPGAPAGADPDPAVAGARGHRLPDACCRGPTAAAGWWRSRSWCRRRRSGT